MEELETREISRSGAILTMTEVRAFNSAIHDSVRVDTMYKTKDKKVRPVDLGILDGSHPRGISDWLENVKKMERALEPLEPRPFDHLVMLKFSIIHHSERLT